DLRALATLCHSRGARLAVDSTFASPALQHPLELGADVVMHSATKYMGGHSDVTAGMIVSAKVHPGEAISYVASVIGRKLSPFDSWLVLRGIKTLPTRMHHICATAQAIAESIVTHPRVVAVHYPGLDAHPDHA